MIITGLQPTSWSETASQVNGDEPTSEHTADTDKSVIEFAGQQLNVPISPLDISTEQSLKKKPGNTMPAPVIVRFTKYEIRDAIYKARFQLKHVTGRKLIFNEDLTKTVSSLFREARNLVKSKSLHGAWTAGGQLYAKRSNHSSCRAKKITTEAELRQLVIEDSI